METAEVCGYLGKRVLRPEVRLGPSEVSPPDSSEEDLWLLEAPYSSQGPKIQIRTFE